MPDCGVHYLWFAFVCFLIRSHPPVGEMTPQVDIPGPKSRRWGVVPHCRFGMTAWTHLANGEGSCPPLRGPYTEL